jgi:hypothetical protein
MARSRLVDRLATDSSRQILPFGTIFDRNLQEIKPEMKAFLAELRKKIVIGVVGGSDFVKVPLRHR